MKFDVGSFTFDSTFDSGNLQRVESVRTTAECEYEQWFRVDPVGFGRETADFDDAIRELSIFQLSSTFTAQGTPNFARNYALVKVKIESFD